MSWKKSTPYFFWQAVRHARSWAHFNHMRSYLKRWKEALSPGHNSVADESAWITFDALDYLDRWIKPQHRVFEYGGGGSTLYFCKRAGQVITVEHDREWYAILEQKIKDKKYKHWEGNFVAPELLQDKRPRSPENPDDFVSNSKGLENYSFEKYAKTITHYEPGSFDLILVDGRARPSCIRQSLPYLKPGGLLVIDNADRAYYTASFQDILAKDFKTILNQYAPIPFIPYFIITMIFEKR